MIDAVQLTALVVSGLLLAYVLDLVRRKKLTEEYSFVWILCALALIVLSLGRRYLDRLAVGFGIYYPPAALLLVLGLFVFIASVSFSVVVSRQRQQIETLIEEAALLEAQVRELRADHDTPKNTSPDA
jgi:hypothetical protein